MTQGGGRESNQADVHGCPSPEPTTRVAHVAGTLDPSLNHRLLHSRARESVSNPTKLQNEAFPSLPSPCKVRLEKHRGWMKEARHARTSVSACPGGPWTRASGWVAFFFSFFFFPFLIRSLALAVALALALASRLGMYEREILSRERKRNS
jgi:hypothetical protein